MANCCDFIMASWHLFAVASFPLLAVDSHTARFDSGGARVVAAILRGRVAGDGRDLQFVRGVGAVHCGGGRRQVRGHASAAWLGALPGCWSRRIPKRYEHCSLDNYERDLAG